ncbi:MAG: potassium-transporting ATPase subunit KdpA [Deltaproteobacteria bacterium]|nr:potassium-transporting ATPase subunit KdpA [Deltaproteobacteria bacterium]
MMRWLEYSVFIAILITLAKPVGLYIAHVFKRQPTFLDRCLCPVESVLYRLLGVHPDKEMTPKVYLASFLAFGALGTLFLFLPLWFQSYLPGGVPIAPRHQSLYRDYRRERFTVTKTLSWGRLAPGRLVN